MKKWTTIVGLSFVILLLGARAEFAWADLCSVDSQGSLALPKCWEEEDKESFRRSLLSELALHGVRELVYDESGLLSSFSIRIEGYCPSGKKTGNNEARVLVRIDEDESQMSFASEDELGESGRVMALAVAEHYARSCTELSLRQEQGKNLNRDQDSEKDKKTTQDAAPKPPPSTTNESREEEVKASRIWLNGGAKGSHFLAQNTNLFGVGMETTLRYQKLFMSLGYYFSLGRKNVPLGLVAMKSNEVIWSGGVVLLAPKTGSSLRVGAAFLFGRAVFTGEEPDPQVVQELSTTSWYWALRPMFHIAHPVAGDANLFAKVEAGIGGGSRVAAGGNIVAGTSGSSAAITLGVEMPLGTLGH